VARIDIELRGSGKTVLVVDDNPGIRQAVSRAFLSDGFTVCGEAANGQEAISLCKQLKPDLIILDLSMPMMDGLQAAPQLRRLVPNTPIILLTMYGSAFKQDQVAAIGVDLVLSKMEPFSELLDKAHALLRARPSDLAQGASG
jgi:DNA-binding NarL/FixJ family response regulator